ncbi:MAG: ABC transporter permease [Verrucomicrobiaceae bacterium]
MFVFFALLTKELRAFFFSPVAYVVMALVMVINGFSFRAAVEVMVRTPQTGSIVTMTFNSQWFWLSYFFIFPLLTMRLFAEERKLGTWETLFTAPVRTWQVVGSKYLAAVLFYCLLWVPSLANFAIFQIMTHGAAEIPSGALSGTYLLLFFMGLFNLAVGCFASSLTANQIVAAVLAFTISLLHFMVGIFIIHLRRNAESFVDFAYYIATIEHIKVFITGLLDTHPLTYYASLAALFLFFTHQVVEYRRWKM